MSKIEELLTNHHNFLITTIRHQYPKAFKEVMPDVWEIFYNIIEKCCEKLRNLEY